MARPFAPRDLRAIRPGARNRHGRWRWRGGAGRSWFCRPLARVL